MPFLTKADLTTDIYTEDIDAITEGNDDDVTAAINKAIAEAQGYFDRYDVDALFARTGDERDPILIGSLTAMALQWLTRKCPANQNVKQIREDATTARVWLRRVQAAEVKPRGWPLIAPPEKATFFHMSSNPKRGNHF
ncbi:hypothetical protein [Mucilaginibacter kameinonensis]|uniref:hypothetical protein n=1 Tax=Mucilaginibacter kameinonensis TaxID=452286 RepID=UPI000EF7A6DA|nr:hypothetical protein [Mucilaginibacter kameinonensis]